MKRLLVILVTTLTLFAGSRKTPPDDNLIHDEVARKLANDVDVKGGALNVDVKQGVVTLKGSVTTEKAQAKAERLAKKIKGVSRVENQLTIK